MLFRLNVGAQRRTVSCRIAIGFLLVGTSLGSVHGPVAGAAERPAARVLQAPPIPPAAPPLPVVESSGPLGNLSEPAFIRGHDKGQSTLYDNGQGLKFSYWSFGDTMVDSASQPDYFIGNTAARTTDLNMADNVGSWTYDATDAFGDPHEAFPLPPGYDPAQYRVWGGSVVADPANDRMIGIYHIVQGTSTSRGYGVATWSEATGTWTARAIVNPTDPARPYVLWPEGGPAFNTGMLIEGGHLYVYGCYSSFRCSLARVPATNPAAVLDRSAWRFYSPATSTGCTAGTWSTNVSCATPLPSAEVNSAGQPVGMLGGGAGMSVFWNAYLGTYMAIYSRPGSNDLVYSVAYDREGPWSAPGLIARGKPGVAGSVNYAGYAHPEFAEQNGKVQYVTYARPLGSLDMEFGLTKVTFGTAPATYQRGASGEAYFADSANSLRINAAGPTAIDTTGQQGSSTETRDADRQGTIYAPGTGRAGTAAVVRVDSQCCSGSAAVSGLVMRNSIPLAHNAIFTTAGRGYVALVAAPGGGVSLRWDSDGDQDLDSRLPASPNSVSGAVWLRLTRSGATTFEGAYSTNSTTGLDGTWTSVGTATVATAAAQQDVGIFSAGPNPATLQRGVFSRFEIRPGWVSTWSTPLAPTPSGAPNHAGFQNQTLRLPVHTTRGGTALRVRISNAFGTAPLAVGAASVGQPTAPGSADLVPGSLRSLTFGGQASASVPAGQTRYSDPVTMTVGADQDLAVNLFFSQATGIPPYHQIAQQPTYIYSGNKTGDPAGAGYAANPPKTAYFVDSVDVFDAQAVGTVATLGDSITDGVFVPPGSPWPDKLFDRLQAAGNPRLAVSNAGHAGARADGAPAKADRDALSLSGARTIVILLGVNDLGSATPPSAATIVGHYRTVAAQARAKGIRVLVGTITPLGVHTTSANEPVRQAVNAYLRSSSEFDGIIDFDATLRSPTDPTQIRDGWALSTGSAHPNAIGYDQMAQAINLTQLIQPPRSR